MKKKKRKKKEKEIEQWICQNLHSRKENIEWCNIT